MVLNTSLGGARVVDGMYVSIVFPVEYPAYYYNRKGFHYYCARYCEPSRPIY